jgi:hypothetical protein
MAKWQSPGAFRESGNEQLGAFGVRSLEAARINMVDPPVSERQRRFMGAELARKRAGKKTHTGMSEKQLREFARKP